MLYLHENGKNVDVKASARALLATSSFGRVKVPMSIDGSLSFPKDSVPAISTNGLNINILNIPINIDADVRFTESTDIKAKVSIPQTRLTHPDFPEQELGLRLDVRAETDSKGRINVGLDRFNAGIKGVELSTFRFRQCIHHRNKPFRKIKFPRRIAIQESILEFFCKSIKVIQTTNLEVHIRTHQFEYGFKPG